jgi:hypothetical protein
MSLLSRALNSVSIQRQKEVIGKWFDGEQAGAEFAAFASDRVDDLAPLGLESRDCIREIQRMLVSDMVAHGDIGNVCESDPLIREFFALRGVNDREAN